jgi:hypothetical protein
MRGETGARVVTERLRIGTRKSAMALAQTEEIARQLKAKGVEVEIVRFETTGDIDQTGKLLPHGGKGGAFVAQIREAVLAGRLHAAMHSLKDMPGNEDTPGLVIGATLSRDPPGDVLVLRPGLSFDEFRRARGKGWSVSALLIASPTNFRLPTCCRRWGRGSLRWNAPCAISRRAVFCLTSTTRPRMPALMPSARCCGC